MSDDLLAVTIHCWQWAGHLCVTGPIGAGTDVSYSGDHTLTNLVWEVLRPAGPTIHYFHFFFYICQQIIFFLITVSLESI